MNRPTDFSDRLALINEAREVRQRTGMTPLQLEQAYLQSHKQLNAVMISVGTLRAMLEGLGRGIDGLHQLAQRLPAEQGEAG